MTAICRCTSNVNPSGKTWDRFQVEKVVPFGEKLIYSPPDPVTQAEEKDDVGLILGLTFGLLALLVISVIIVYFAWRRKWCKNRDFNFLNSPKKPRVQIIEIKSLGDKSFDDGFEMTANKIKGTKPTSILAVSPLQHTELPKPEVDTNEPLLNIPRPQTPIFMKTSPNLSIQRPETPVFGKSSPDYSGISSRQEFKSVTLSPSLLGNPVSNASTPAPTKPASFNPNRGFDFVTGWIYEDDPETKTRKWLRTPDNASR